MSRHDCNNVFEAGHKKWFRGPKRATSGNRGHKTTVNLAPSDQFFVFKLCGGWAGVIKIFWSIALNDLRSKSSVDLRWLFDPVLHSSLDDLVSFLWARSLAHFLSDPSPIIGYPCQWLTNSLTHSLIHCFLVHLMWPWRVKMPTQNMLMLLLMLMLRNVFTTVWCRFGSLVLSKLLSWSSGKILKGGQYFATDAWLRIWSLILVEILKLGLVKIVLRLVEMLMFGWDILKLILGWDS